MKISFLFITLIFLQSQAFADDQIRMAGSSTVYPFAASVAEHFGKAGDFRTPVVEATGTGAGFKLFCAGAGGQAPYITNASRAMLPSERDECRKNGVDRIVEIKFGYDGITVAGSVKSPVFKLSRQDLFLALAHDVPRNGKLVTNDYTNWQQIDPSLPDMPIKVYGTSPVSGTYDTFIELVMKKGCEETKAFAEVLPDEEKRERACKTLREDGRFIETGENGNLIAEKLIEDPTSLGIMGFSFLEENEGRLHGSIIDGVSPSFESIQNASYPVSRPLYFYVKLPLRPGMKEYIQEFLSEAAIGDEGYLVEKGLVPLPQAMRTQIRKTVMQEIR